MCRKLCDVATSHPKPRADRVAETRRRIIEATLRLHQTLGPAHTSISAIAAEAGVQRHTVYSHFPDEREIYIACGGLFAERNPLPAVGPWRDVGHPRARTRRALSEVYAFYRSHERELGPIVRDMPLLPDLVGRRFGPYRDAAADAIVDGWGLRGGRAVKVRALVKVALRFETWRALCRDESLDDEAAVAVMSDAILCAAEMD